MNKKIRVLMISHQVDRTGAPTSFLNILKKLYNKKEYVLDVISVRGGKLADEYYLYSNSMHILNYNIKESIFQKVISFFKLLYLIQKSKADIIIINTSVTLRANLASFLMRKPFIIYVRESENMLNSRLGLLRKYSLKLATEIISVSYYSKQWVRKYVNHNKINVIHNGIDFSKLNYSLPLDHFNAEKVTIGIIGYMTKRKGFDYFAQIINKLMNISEKYKFLIIGDFIDENEKSIFFDSVKDYKNNILVTGIVENVYPEINKCDLIVMTSREESLPRSVMEASLLSKPVVAFDIAGTKEMLPLNYDYLVSPFDINEFVDKTANLSKKNIIKTIGEINRKYITKNFSLDITISKIENILLKVVQDAKLK